MIRCTVPNCMCRVVTRLSGDLYCHNHAYRKILADAKLNPEYERAGYKLNTEIGRIEPRLSPDLHKQPRTP